MTREFKTVVETVCWLFFNIFFTLSVLSLDLGNFLYFLIFIFWVLAHGFFIIKRLIGRQKMDFIEATKLLEKGACVRKSSWGKGWYIWGSFYLVITKPEAQSTGGWIPTTEEILAEDWEEVKNEERVTT